MNPTTQEIQAVREAIKNKSYKKGITVTQFINELRKNK